MPKAFFAYLNTLSVVRRSELRVGSPRALKFGMKLQAEAQCTHIACDVAEQWIIRDRARELFPVEPSRKRCD